MAQRIVYKDGEEFICQHMRQVNEMLDQGWSLTPQSKKTAKPKKAKVEVEAVELKPVGDDSKVIDFGNIDEEK